MNFRELYKQDNSLVKPAPEFVDDLIRNLKNQSKSKHIVIRRLSVVTVAAASVMCLVLVGAAILITTGRGFLNNYDTPLGEVENQADQAIYEEYDRQAADVGDVENGDEYYHEDVEDAAYGDDELLQNSGDIADNAVDADGDYLLEDFVEEKSKQGEQDDEYVRKQNRGAYDNRPVELEPSLSFSERIRIIIEEICVEVYSGIYDVMEGYAHG